MHSSRGKWTSRKLVLMNPLTISSEGLVFKTALNEFYLGYVWRHDPNLEKKKIFLPDFLHLSPSLPWVEKVPTYFYLFFIIISWNCWLKIKNIICKRLVSQLELLSWYPIFDRDLRTTGNCDKLSFFYFS